LNAFSFKLLPEFSVLNLQKKYIAARLITWRTRHSWNGNIILDLKHKMGQNGLD
jgi:hypothetical protein